MPNWNWATGIPLDAPRADLVAADIPRESITQLLPNFHTSPIQLVSTASAQPIRIINVDGHPVRNCADLYAAVYAKHKSDSLQVDLIGDEGREAGVKTNPQTLHLLASATAPQQPILQSADNGNPTLYIREPNISAHITARVERSRGILQLVVSYRNLSNTELRIPREARAECNGQPLRCLSVSETLDLLYGPQKRSSRSKKEEVIDETQYSFAAASNKPDYLVPTNYTRLSGKLENDSVGAGIAALQPAFATVPGAAYPGPVILGDARAITGFLLRPEVSSAKDGEKTGWIVFGDQVLKSGGLVEITIDFGNGPKKMRFSVPRPDA